MRKTLSLRPAAERAPTPARTGWNVSETRRKRLKDMAKTARRNPTDAQKLLWTRLAAQRAGGFKFHRQVVIGSTIVAFACPARWLVVEIAGKANAEVEAILDRRLSDVGVRVMRFTEAQITDDLDHVVEAIVAELNQPFNRRDAVAANAAAAARSGSHSPVAAHDSSADSAFDDDEFENGFDVEAEDDDADIDDNVFDAAFVTAKDEASDDPASDAEMEDETGLDAVAEADGEPASGNSALESLFDSRAELAEAEEEQAAQ